MNDSIFVPFIVFFSILKKMVSLLHLFFLFPVTFKWFLCTPHAFGHGLYQTSPYNKQVIKLDYPLWGHWCWIVYRIMGSVLDSQVMLCTDMSCNVYSLCLLGELSDLTCLAQLGELGVTWIQVWFNMLKYNLGS